jgi:caa(3)-type oxidase subunit IV
MTDASDQPEQTAAADVPRPSGRMLLVTGIGLIALAGASWGLSSLGAPPIVALLIAAIKAIWIATVFMELRHAHTVPRTIAVIAVLFVALLCAGTLADVDLR